MTHDTTQRLRLQQPYRHHRRSLFSIRAGRDTARQFLTTVTKLDPDDGYDWLQRIGRTRATRRWTVQGRDQRLPA